MLHHLAGLIEPEYVDPRPIAISGPFLVTAENDIIALGYHPLKLYPLTRVLAGHPLEIRDERRLPVQLHARGPLRHPSGRRSILRSLQKYSPAVESSVRSDDPSIGMVSDMVQSAAADDVFHALSNPTRRKVLERLSAGPATVSELAAPFDMQLPSFVQHLSVLEQSRLIKSKKRGRVRTYEIAPERFKVVEDWLSARRRLWEARLDQFDQYVKQLKEKESKS